MRFLIYVVSLIFLASCGPETTPDDDGSRDESFLAAIGTGGKADAILIEDGSPEALGVLAVANELTYDELNQDVGLQRRAAEAITIYREGDPTTATDDRTIGSLDELDRIAWVGMSAFIKLYEYAKQNGYFDRFGVMCQVDADCVGADAICFDGQCADVDRMEYAIPNNAWIDSAGFDDDGNWKARLGNGSSTIWEWGGTGAQRTTQTTSVALSPYVTADLIRRPDESLEPVNRYNRTIDPASGPSLQWPSDQYLQSLVYAPDGTLFALLKSDDNRLSSTAPPFQPTFTVYRQGARIWTEEFEVVVPFDDAPSGALVPSGTTVALFIQNSHRLRRFERAAVDVWDETNDIPLTSLGLPQRPWSPYVAFTHGHGKIGIIIIALPNDPKVLLFNGSSFEAHDAVDFEGGELVPSATGLFVVEASAGTKVGNVENGTIHTFEVSLVGNKWRSWYHLSSDGRMFMIHDVFDPYYIRDTFEVIVITPR